MKNEKEDPLIPHAKLLRLLQLIALLKAGRWNIADLAERFDTSQHIPLHPVNRVG